MKTINHTNMPLWVYYSCWCFLTITQPFFIVAYTLMVIGWLVLLHYWPSQDSHFTAALAVVGTLFFTVYQTLSLASSFGESAFECFQNNKITRYVIRKFGYHFTQGVIFDPKFDPMLFEQVRELAKLNGGKSYFCGSDWSQLKNDFEIYAKDAVRYRVGDDLVLDMAIDRIGYELTPTTSYWELVDFFFSHGMPEEAKIAQRLAGISNESHAAKD